MSSRAGEPTNFSQQGGHTDVLLSTFAPLEELDDLTKGKTILLATSLNLSDPGDHTYKYTLSRPYPEEFAQLPPATRVDNQRLYVVLDSVLKSGRLKRCTMEEFPISMLKDEQEFAEAERRFWGVYARSCVGGVSEGTTGSIRIYHESEKVDDQQEASATVPTVDSSPVDEDLQITSLGAPSSGTFQDRYAGFSPSQISSYVWGELKMKVEEEETNLPEVKRRARAQLVTPEVFDEEFLRLRPTALGRLASRATGIDQVYRYSSEPAAVTLFRSLASMRPGSVLSGVASFWNTMTGKDEPNHSDTHHHHVDESPPDCLLPIGKPDNTHALESEAVPGPSEARTSPESAAAPGATDDPEAGR
ncbi:hypothetical protein IAR50_005684 [Cryptococcus sp. DSM 104548]